MQDSQHRIKKVVNWLKWVIPILLLLIVYWKYGDSISSDEFEEQIVILFGENKVVLLVFFLSFINWALETTKWKILVRRIETISFWKSYKSVLMGLGLSFSLPRSIGDGLGRFWGLEKHGREAVVGALLLSRVSQLSCTVLGGLTGLVYFFFANVVIESFDLMITLAISFALGIAIFLILFFRQANKENRFSKYIITLKSYSRKELYTVWGIALVRYLVFTFQYFLIIYIFTENFDPLSVYAGVMSVLFVKGIVPSTSFIGDEAVKQSFAVLVFSMIGVGEEKVFVSSTTIWVLNLLIPTIIGMVFLPSAKIFLKSSGSEV